MKKNIIIAFYMLMITNMFGQTPDFCGISGEAEHRAYILSHSSVFSRGIGNPAPVDCSPRVFNVRFNVFNNDQGTNFCSRNGIPFGEEQFLDCIKILNMEYNSFNVFFKYRGYHFYGGSDGNGYLSDLMPDPMVNTVFTRLNQISDLCEKNVININFVEKAVSYDNYNGPDPSQTVGTTIGTETLYTHQMVTGLAIMGRPIIAIVLPSFFGVPRYGVTTNLDFGYDKKLTLCHEMAHVFGLFHTYESSYGQCEHVTRVQGPNFNALTEGDFILDTPAQPLLFNYNFNPATCRLKSTFLPNTDCQGTPFDVDSIFFGNFMNGSLHLENPGVMSNLPNCIASDPIDLNLQYHFTLGQKEFMRNFINIAPGVESSTGYLSTTITDALTNVNSLFQPYSQDKILGEVLSTTDNGDGTAKVCRNYYSGNFKFQPGFDYTFPNNTSPDPLTATKYQTPVVVQPPFNCPITIAQLANCGSNGSGHAYTVCRGVVCLDEPFTGGSITKTENLGSTYFSTETLDENQITDPNLINSLEGQMYHIIKKETTSGAESQQTIYKN
jgi:hypothetical protein